MIYRHPHVFGSGKADTAEEVLINWEELKKKEKRQEEGEKRMSIGVFLSSTGMGRMEMCADGFSERVPSTRTALYLR